MKTKQLVLLCVLFLSASAVFSFWQDTGSPEALAQKARVTFGEAKREGAVAAVRPQDNPPVFQIPNGVPQNQGFAVDYAQMANAAREKKEEKNKKRTFWILLVLAILTIIGLALYFSLRDRGDHDSDGLPSSPGGNDSGDRHHGHGNGHHQHGNGNGYGHSQD